MARLNEEYIKRTATLLIFIILIILTYFLLQPILLSIILGIILAFVFNPLYTIVFKATKSKNLSASLMCILLAAIIILPIWFFTPIVLDQSIKVFFAIQEVDFIGPLKSIFPSLFASDQFSQEAGSIIHSFISRAANYMVNALSQLILNIATIILQLLVVFFTFFFVLRDRDVVVDYIKSILPFSKEVEKKLFEQSKGITSSVIYGQIIIGIIQGLIVGIGFFIGGVSNALFLTLLATTAAILPLIGPILVWVPVAIYLFVGGNTSTAIIVTVFGLIASTIDNFIRPIITSRATRMHSAIVLIGMIGGLVMFGILGFIIGPLILAYLFILLELYRKKPAPGVFIQAEENK